MVKEKNQDNPSLALLTPKWFFGKSSFSRFNASFCILRRGAYVVEVALTLKPLDHLSSFTSYPVINWSSCSTTLQVELP